MILSLLLYLVFILTATVSIILNLYGLSAFIVLIVNPWRLKPVEHFFSLLIINCFKFKNFREDKYVFIILCFLW